MPLRDDAGPVDDRWTRVEPGAPLQGPSILTLEDAEARGAALDGLAAADLGLHIPNDAAVETVAPWFDRVALISVDFPSFADGRGFSLARSLRARGFDGRLRAAGPVIADQYAYLRACGFDEVETPDRVSNRQPEPQWAAAAARMTLSYQRGYAAAGGPRNILEARAAARRA